MRKLAISGTILLTVSSVLFAKELFDVKTEATAFLDHYQRELARLEIQASLAAWKAANTGKKEDFDAAAQASLALRRFHSDADAYQKVQRLLKSADQLPPLQARALQVAFLAYQRNQLPPDLLKQVVEREAEIERLFGTFRANLNGRRYSNNDLLEMLRTENNSAKRRQIWEALKQVGAAVAPKLVELAELRNQAARTLGFANYWQMAVQLQEHDPKQLLAIFDELDRLTRAPFVRMKRELDSELARRFRIAPDQIMPWHFDNPFFQAPPPSEKVDLDEFFKGKTKEQIVEIARRYYQQIGLPADSVLARSDLYEREGKDQHAFCTDIDRAGDVRILCNIKPTAEWMATTLHELGHAVYDLHIDRSLPFNLRRPAHAFTTEGVAMLFGAKVQEPPWLVTYAGADSKRVQQLADAIRQQRRREQLIFARWTMVMLHFEKAFYENPRGDLNTLWWDTVERYQHVPRPPQRNEPDWAAKPHFTVAPVYYHNYMLGELFASQLRHVLAGLSKQQGAFTAKDAATEKLIGDFLKRSVFRPGALQPWPRFVESATGEPLTARYFATEVE